MKMQQNKKILFITPLFPYPPTDGWRIRTFNIIKNISLFFDITIISFIRPEEEKYIIELEKYAKVITIPKKESRLSLSKNIVKSSIGKTPLIILRDYSKEIVKKLKEFPEFDYIFFESIHSAQYADLLKGKKILDAHNVESMIWKRCLESEKNPLKKIFLKKQTKKIYKYESSLLSKFDYVFTCSEKDKELLDKGQAKFIVIPNGTNVLDNIPDTNTDPKNLLFIGSLDYPPNKDAVLWFIKKILPSILDHIPDTRLYIVGKNPGKLKKLQNENITFTGFVESLQPYYDSSSIFICPLRSGSGTRLKILEAMSQKKAVISTSIGAEGLNVGEGNIIISDNEKDFAESIISLIQNPSKISETAENGYELVKSNYDWRKITKKIINLLSIENDKSDAHS